MSKQRKPEGYKAFGSFFTDNVQDMVHMPADAWKNMVPQMPDEVAAALGEVSAVGAFGAPARTHFFIDFTVFTYLNHGAFGACLRQPYAVAHAWQRHCETQPLRFLDRCRTFATLCFGRKCLELQVFKGLPSAMKRFGAQGMLKKITSRASWEYRELFPQMVALLRQIAEFIGAAPPDVTCLPNATAGLNTVLASIRLHEGDEVLMLDVGYGALKKIAQAMCEKAGARLVQAHVDLPVRCAVAKEHVRVDAQVQVAVLEADMLRDVYQHKTCDPHGQLQPRTECRSLEQIETALLDAVGERTRLVMLDSVSSNTALCLPLPEVIRALRQRYARCTRTPSFAGGHHLLMLPWERAVRVQEARRARPC